MKLIKQLLTAIVLFSVANEALDLDSTLGGEQSFKAGHNLLSKLLKRSTKTTTITPVPTAGSPSHTKENSNTVISAIREGTYLDKLHSPSESITHITRTLESLPSGDIMEVKPFTITYYPLDSTTSSFKAPKATNTEGWHLVTKVVSYGKDYNYGHRYVTDSADQQTVLVVEELIPPEKFQPSKSYTHFIYYDELALRKRINLGLGLSIGLIGYVLFGCMLLGAPRTLYYRAKREGNSYSGVSYKVLCWGLMVLVFVVFIVHNSIDLLSQCCAAADRKLELWNAEQDANREAEQVHLQLQALAVTPRQYLHSDCYMDNQFYVCRGGNIKSVRTDLGSEAAKRIKAQITILKNDPAVIEGEDGQYMQEHVTRTKVMAYEYNEALYNSRTLNFLKSSRSMNKVVKFADLEHIKEAVYYETICCICIEEYKAKENVVILPCRHFLHFRCFGIMHLRWASAKGPIKCPICHLDLCKHLAYYKDKGIPPSVRFLNNE